MDESKANYYMDIQYQYIINGLNYKSCAGVSSEKAERGFILIRSIILYQIIYIIIGKNL